MCAGPGFWWMRRLPRSSKRKCLTALVMYTDGRVDAGVVDRLAQQAAGRPDERQTLLVLDVAGLLADEDDLGVRRAAAEDRLGGVLVELAALAARPRRP